MAHTATGIIRETQNSHLAALEKVYSILGTPHSATIKTTRPSTDKNKGNTKR